MRDMDWLTIAGKRLDTDTLYNDPVKWLNTYIDFSHNGRRGGLAPYQERAIAEIPTAKRVAVRGPHGLGKSTLAALIVIWFSITRERAGIDWKVPTTATAWRHLTIYLWPEIHKWLKRVKWDELGMQPPNSRTQLLDLRLKLKHGSASAIASDDPVNIEGAHADSILYVFDEAKAIPPETWNAAEGALSGGKSEGLPEAFALAISTPGEPNGRFYEIHTRKPGLEDWTSIHVTIEEAQKAGRINKDWAEQRRKQWGEDSAIFKNRVLGEFHSGDEDAVIPLSWVEAANERWRAWNEAGRPMDISQQPVSTLLNPADPDSGVIEPPFTIPQGAHVIGVDVARSGNDSTAIVSRVGSAITNIERYRYADTMQTTARVTAMLHPGYRAVVDSIGIGSGVVDRLKELKMAVVPFTGSAKTFHKDRLKEYGFTNTRSAAWWNMRELLDPSSGSEIMLPDDDQLTADLLAPHWSITSGVPPRIKIEVKEDLVKRIGRSPDTADAVVMSFFVDTQRTMSEVVSPVSRPPTPPKKTEDGVRVAPKIRSGSLRRLALSPLGGSNQTYRG